MKPPDRLTKTQLPPKRKMNGPILLHALPVPRSLTRWTLQPVNCILSLFAILQADKVALLSTFITPSSPLQSC